MNNYHDKVLNEGLKNASVIGFIFDYNQGRLAVTANTVTLIDIAFSDFPFFMDILLRFTSRVMIKAATNTNASYKINASGLMRCCIKSVDEEMKRRSNNRNRQAVIIENEVIHCVYCKDKIVVLDGIWQWDGGVKDGKN